MRFNEQWLREWVNPDVDTDTLSHQLTMLGLEVDAVEPVAGSFSDVVVGEVVHIEAHPDADKLRVCQVNVGRAEPLTIVCGASNVALGVKVPAALIGAKLPSFKIKKSKLRGVESFGMLCSSVELGMAESSDGLMILADDAVPGTDIREYLKLDDVVIEIGLTPNRGDCLCLLGVAREVGVINQIPLVEPENDSSVVITLSDTFPVNLDAPQCCPRYIGRVIRDVDAKAKTPVWMQERLRRCGVRSVSPVVDVTNYVMLELGQPMHAFDFDLLEGGIHVRQANAGESLTLLGGQDVTLEEDTLVIADESRAIAMAGIMGGEATAVSDDTTNLFLESAFFAPEAVIGRARRYGLHTDSSHRFERGVDPELPVRAIKRATELLLQIVGGKAGPLIEATDAEHIPERQSITLRQERIRRILGTDIPQSQVTEMLSSLGMKVREQGKQWIVTPPGFRFDLKIEADLIEEVGRIYGYSNLPVETPSMPMRPGLPQEAVVVDRQLRNVLVRRDYLEAITYSFVDPALQAQIEPGVESIELANPISAEMSVMRTSLWPGLAQVLVYNQNRQQSRIRVFELGVKYLKQGNEISEKNVISGAVMGSVAHEQWGQAARKTDFFDVKADVVALLGVTGEAEQYRFEAVQHPALHPGQAAKIVASTGEEIGLIGALHPSLQRSLGLSQSAFLFELSLSALKTSILPNFSALSRFPAIRRDLALVVDKSVTSAQVSGCITDVSGEYLKNLQLFDVYSGEGVESGRKSLALGLTFQDSSRTLTDEVIDQLLAKVLKELDEKLNASLRE